MKKKLKSSPFDPPILINLLFSWINIFFRWKTSDIDGDDFETSRGSWNPETNELLGGESWISRESMVADLHDSLQMDHGWRLIRRYPMVDLCWCDVSNFSEGLRSIGFPCQWIYGMSSVWDWPWQQEPRAQPDLHGQWPFEAKTLEASWNAKRCGWDWHHCWRSLVYPTAAWRVSKRLPLGEVNEMGQVAGWTLVDIA